ncbi:MAG: transposase [Lentisphaeraceae bacterium]|nr:transposase [Lentisphaeraceae bacterium]
MIKLASFLERHKQQFFYTGKLDSHQFRVMDALRICRTPEARGVLYSCGECESLRLVYHSCGNRFCPNCQNHRTTKWLHRQKQALLPCDYFMITFTLPEVFRHVPRKRLADFYKAFFQCATATLKELCKTELKGECGMLAVLHTNGRSLQKHPHIHFLVPGLVLNKKENTVKRITSGFFIHFEPLRKKFRGKFLKRLKEIGIGFPGYLYNKEWNVNCEKKGNGVGALEYLSRYLVKGVVSQHSLTENKNSVTLNYRNSTTQEKESIEFGKIEFLERLAQHVLPKGLRSVRHYGFLAPAAKKKLKRIQLLLQVRLPEEPEPQAPVLKCPCCKAKMTPIIFKMSSQWLEQRIKRHISTRSPPKRLKA